MPEKTVGLIATYWKWIAGALGTVFGLGVAQSRIVKKSELYNPDGSQVYVPRTEFKEVVTKIEDQGKTLSETNRLLGRIEQYMEDH